MKPLLRSACVLAAVVLPMAASAAPPTVRPGTLTVGTVTTYAPMAYRDPNTGALTGVDIDLAKAIAAELGLKIDLVDVAFAQLMPSLQTGRIDMAMAGMSDRPARRGAANFIDYVRSGAQFYTLSEKAADIGGIEGMCGKTVAYSRGAQWNDRIDEWSKANCEAKGKPPVRPVGSENTADTRTQLLAGRVDAGVQGSETFGYLQTLDPGRFTKIGGIFSEYLVGIPFLKDSAPAGVLMEEVRKALLKLQENGTYDEILKRYGVGDNAYKPVAINQGT